MEDIDILYEKLTRLLEAQRCYMSASNKEVIIRGKHYDEAFKAACQINYDIAEVFGLKPKTFSELELDAKTAVKESMDLEKIYSMESPY